MPPAGAPRPGAVCHSNPERVRTGGVAKRTGAAGVFGRRRSSCATGSGRSPFARIAACSLAKETGARGVALFNRFYQADFDIETLEVRPTLHFSTPSELLPRLHWAAILYGNLNIDLAITGGVHSAEDVLKSIMAGASMTMMASALHIHGIEHITRVLADMRYWLEKHEYGSLWETRGCLSRRSVPDTSPFDRGNYIKTLSSYSLRQTVAAF